MTERRLQRLREALGWLAAAFCLCAALALADSFVDSMRTGPTTFSLVPGGTENLSGPLPPDAPDAASMLVAIDHPGLVLDITTQTQGFWMGNRMWQGTLRADPGIAPGTATVSLRAPGETPGPVQTFTIRIFPDQDALKAASNSTIIRLAGISPLLIAAGCTIAAALVGLFVFLASRRLESLWARQGKAVVYMTKKTPDGLLISFGLGTEHGFSTGATITVSDESGLPVATASVVRCSNGDAAALVLGEGKVTLGNVVRLVPAGTRTPASPPPAPHSRS